jgi:hypothetical protein
VKKKLIFIIILFAVIISGSFLLLVYKKPGKTFIAVSEEIINKIKNEEPPKEEPKNLSPISGLSCENYSRRPIAVMLSSDTITRPLSGLSDADMVFEMQVVQNSITRLVAVFVCDSPEEVGSIRSSRDDFIPLVMGLDAIYAHWGGSHFALDKLNSGIMDNIDALKNPFGAFFRKNTIYAPHNGFTSISRLVESAKQLGYRIENKFEGYPHEEVANLKKQNSKQGVLKIGYSYPWNVEWNYNAERNSYFRTRGGRPELDKNNSQQVEAKVVAVIRANSRPLEGQYNDVEIEGTGDLTVYQNNEEIKGIWKKDKGNMGSKLYFLGADGQEIKFVPGQIWVEIIEPGR